MQLNSLRFFVVEMGGEQKLVVPQSLHQEVLQECYDILALGHIGICKTMDLVDLQFHWQRMCSDVTSYVQSCPVCQEANQQTSKGRIVEALRNSNPKVGPGDTYLVTNLPNLHRYTAVAIFVDRLTKLVHFAPCTKEITAPDYTQLFVDYVFRLHGFTDVIVSDRDPHFTSKFWSKLFDLLGTDLWFSTIFHW